MAGCAATGGYGDDSQTTQCIEPPPITASCNNPGNVPRVVLTLANMNTNPASVCAVPGSTFVMQVAPAPGDPGTVSVVAKDPTHTWLNGTNSPDPAFIEIDVPPWLAPGHYYYGIYTRLGTCVDPRVEIIRLAAIEQAAE
jgi:hypothetical protein